MLRGYTESPRKSGKRIAESDRVGVAKDAGQFGSETYSKEELVAELTAAFLVTEAGLALT
ncbi:MAG: zincin-like metallopeptidase domain-containing protein [Bacillota bacterium]|nr:zincin-like metallopeptidase domain-containing protein [Bacillota bacterium]